MLTFKNYLSESKQQTLVIVDIQPTYEPNFKKSFSRANFFSYLETEPFKKIVYLYNGELTSDTEHTIKNFWMKGELAPNIIKRLKFFDKGYGFFRDMMDSGFSDKEIVDVAKYMIDKGINDFRDFTEEEFSKFHFTKIKNYSEIEDYPIWIPEVWKFIQPLNNVVLVGGGKNECLKEIMLLFQALNKSYTINEQFVY